MPLQIVKQDPADARKPAEQTQLVKEYRKVGPAAINAALLCCHKARKDEPKRSYEPREET